MKPPEKAKFGCFFRMKRDLGVFQSQNTVGVPKEFDRLSPLNGFGNIEISLAQLSLKQVISFI